MWPAWYKKTRRTQSSSSQFMSSSQLTGQQANNGACYQTRQETFHLAEVSRWRRCPLHDLSPLLTTTLLWSQIEIEMALDDDASSTKLTCKAHCPSSIFRFPCNNLFKETHCYVFAETARCVAQPGKGSEVYFRLSSEVTDSLWVKNEDFRRKLVSQVCFLPSR